VNREAKKRPVVVGRDLFYIFSTSYDAACQTEGAFDITIAPIIDYFQVKKDDVVSDMSLQVPDDILQRVSYKNIVLDAANRTIYLRNHAELDVSGVLKGYAVDEVVKLLKAAQVKHALVNGGGTLFAIGASRNRNGWRVGIKDPANPNQIGQTVELENEAVATSGGYERFVMIDGRQYSHIVDPRTGRLVLASGSVSVVSASAIWSDILSTALFVDPLLKDRFEDSRVFFL